MNELKILHLSDSKAKSFLTITKTKTNKNTKNQNMYKIRVLHVIALKASR